jgi:transcriptional regulator with XRE-family HTH domain
VTRQVGANIRELRKKRGWSREKLAAEARISFQTLIRAETGKTRPRLENMVSIADALDVTLDALVGRAAKRRLHD